MAEVKQVPLPNMLTMHVHKDPPQLKKYGWPYSKSELPQSPNCSNWDNLSMINPQFEQLRSWWHLQFEDMMAPAPETIPPFREVNHKINIINPGARYTEWWPSCPQALEGQLREKLARYK